MEEEKVKEDEEDAELCTDIDLHCELLDVLLEYFRKYADHDLTLWHKPANAEKHIEVAKHTMFKYCDQYDHTKSVV